MPIPQTAPNPKHFKGFWPIFIIIVVAVVAGGVILFYAYGNELQDNIYSLNFFHKSETLKATAKPQTKQTPGTGQ